MLLLGVESGFGVDQTNIELHRAEGIGSDDFVGPRALSGDVEVDVLAFSVLHGDEW